MKTELDKDYERAIEFDDYLEERRNKSMQSTNATILFDSLAKLNHAFDEVAAELRGLTPVLGEEAKIILDSLERLRMAGNEAALKVAV